MMSKEKLQDFYNLFELIMVNYATIKNEVINCKKEIENNKNLSNVIDENFIKALNLDEQTEIIMRAIVYIHQDMLDLDNIIYSNRNKNIISSLFPEEMVVG